MSLSNKEIEDQIWRSITYAGMGSNDYHNWWINLKAEQRNEPAIIQEILITAAEVLANE